MKILYFFFAVLIAAPVKAQLFGGQIKSSRAISQQPSYPSGSVFCNGPTLVVDVTNPATGKTWMNRNLGAGQVATSSTDALGKGDLYQWGRRSDGHQCRNSSTTTNLSSSDQPLNGNFIISPNSPNDWRSPQNNNLWQGVNGVNNPCPLGYRLPTEIELNNERLTWISDDEAGAFASPLKFPRANSRGSTDGVIGNTFASIYWASNISSIYSRSLRITISTIGPTLWGNLARANGCSVRCIKETVGSVGSLNCNSATTTGNLIQGSPASNVSTTVPYTGGNGGFYGSQSVSSTGVTGLTASVSQGLLANGSGNLVYTISGTPTSSGTANFAISVGGQSCTFTLPVALPVGTITTLSCGTSTNNGTLTQGIAASGVNSVITYTGGNGWSHNGQTVTSTGVTGLTATLLPDTFAIGSGTLTYTITGTPSTSGTASFALNIGGQSCVLTRTVALPFGTITALSCGTATNNGTLTAGVAASGVSSVIPYTGGNGGTYNGQTVTSTGVTGLIATLTAGTFANGAGTLTYTITGTPANSGTVSFALNIGGQNCILSITVQTLASLYLAGSVFCNGPTAIVDVVNPTTGKRWMDRNLGASRAAAGSADAQANGDLYQWGRRSDGHQCRNSLTTTMLSSTDQPVHGNFIITNASSADWRSPQNTNLWQGVNGVNNPCPSGYRLPSSAELNNERLSWSSQNGSGAFASPLKLLMPGRRNNGSGTVGTVGSVAHYWSSSVSATLSSNLAFDSFNAGTQPDNRAWGFSVRCIKN